MPPRHRRRYPPELRQPMVERVRAGRTPDELAAEFEPSAQTIRSWVSQPEVDHGEPDVHSNDQRMHGAAPLDHGPARCP